MPMLSSVSEETATFASLVSSTRSERTSCEALEPATDSIGCANKPTAGDGDGAAAPSVVAVVGVDGDPWLLTDWSAMGTRSNGNQKPCCLLSIGAKNNWSKVTLRYGRAQYVDEQESQIGRMHHEA